MDGHDVTSSLMGRSGSIALAIIAVALPSLLALAPAAAGGRDNVLTGHVVDDRATNIRVQLIGSERIRRADVRLSNLALGCEDGSVLSVDPKELEIKLGPGRNFVGDRWRAGSHSHREEYLKVKGQFSKNWRHVAGYVFAYVNPKDPDGTDIDPECSTLRDAPWTADAR